MRTAEEIREFVKTEWQKIEDGEPSARHKGPNCPGCLYTVLEFIDSEPPCKHEKVRQYILTAFHSFWVLGPYPNNLAFSVKFCPDCGVELVTLQAKENA